MKKLLTILTFTFSLLAQYEWSAPVQLSELGNSPVTYYIIPSISVDKLGTIHAFWIKLIEDEPYEWHSQIEYRKSNDNGISWSVVENLTPEYLTERIYDLKSVCDSQNNIHLVYLRGTEYNKVMYKKFDGTSWTEPYVVHDYAVTNLEIGIDYSDRLYATWFSAYSSNVYFAFLDSVWSSPQPVSSSGQYTIRDITFDKDNNLYSVGRSTGSTARPFLLKYSRIDEQWTLFEEIYDPGETSAGNAITVSGSDTIYVNISIGPYMDDNMNYIVKKHKNDSVWSVPEYVNENTDTSSRKLFIDNDNNLHLYGIYFGENIELIYSTNSSNTWTHDLINQSNGYFDATYDRIDNFYVAYSNQSTVYFQSKKIEVGIENDDEWIIDNFTLGQNYPNPFNNSTTIQFLLKNSSDINLTIYNSKGESVKNLISDKLSKGNYSYTFSADNLNSGIYYYQLNINGRVKDTKKMLHLK
ncbi:MAG: T9SS type A sorting domain-containing protein [Candidatus Delongbacteria bacterium]|nr:T9SS type A sorting domain-containing protein [Candidatus Delongbacteria bacterium]MCG2759820.1 T9SS type A sorting domain-containing protein [Candidatus Delongbacteria bacterium]